MAKKQEISKEFKLSKDQIKKIAKKVADDHKNNPPPQLLVPDHNKKKSDLSKISIPEKFVGKENVTVAEMLAVRWIDADPNKIEREVKLIEIKMSFKKDGHYTMKDINDFIEDKRSMLHDEDGWCFSEEDAIKRAVNVNVIHDLMQLSNAIIDREACAFDALTVIRKTIKSLRKLSNWRLTVANIRKDLNGEHPVIPDLHRWYVNANREWQRIDSYQGDAEVIDDCVVIKEN